MPMTRVSGRLKTLKAYAWPMERWMARAAGGTSQRLKPGGGDGARAVEEAEGPMPEDGHAIPDRWRDKPGDGRWGFYGWSRRTASLDARPAAPEHSDHADLPLAATPARAR